MIKQLFQTGLTDVKSTDVEGVGSLRFERGAVYKWVKIVNSAAVASVAGDIASYLSSDGYLTASCTTKTADGDAVPVGAGVLMAAGPAATTAQYQWVQLKGAAATNATVAGTPAAGNVLTVTAADNFALTKGIEVDSAGALKRQVGTFRATKKIICDFPF